MLQYLLARADAYPAPRGPDPRRRALLAARDLALFALIAGTGIRVGEAVALRDAATSVSPGEALSFAGARAVGWPRWSPSGPAMRVVLRR